MRPILACDLLRNEHRVLESYLDRFLVAQDLRAERRSEALQLFGDIRRMDAVHFQREEEVLYPSLRSHYPGLLARMDDHHVRIRELEEHLATMLERIPARPGPRFLKQFRSAAADLNALIRHHIVDEEEQLFRVAAACLHAPDQARLAAEMAAIPAPPSDAANYGRPQL